MKFRIKTKTTDKRGNSGTGTRNSWPVAYRWVAMGSLVAYSAVGTRTINVAMAQTAPRPVSRTQISQAPRSFDIPAGLLESVAPAFEQVTGLTVGFSREELRVIHSPGVTGQYDPEAALEKLLAGTGLAFRFTSATAVTLDLASVSSVVEVTASVEALSASTPKYAQLPLETPQTITAVSQQVMQQQGVTTLRDALRNVAGISLAAGEGGAQGDNLTIRGFTARNDLFIDGMRDFGSYYRDPFNTQEVEVLQGPSSVTFGRGSTGGVVNQATKAARLDEVRLGRSRYRHRPHPPANPRRRPAGLLARQRCRVPPERHGR